MSNDLKPTSERKRRGNQVARTIYLSGELDKRLVESLNRRTLAETVRMALEAWLEKEEWK